MSIYTNITLKRVPPPFISAGTIISCFTCKGTGKESSMHGNVICIHCDGTGRDPLPFSEVFDRMTAIKIYYDAHFAGKFYYE